MPKHRAIQLSSSVRWRRSIWPARPLHGLAKRHDISRNLVRTWVAKYDAGSFDSDVVAADIVQAQEARIAALERPRSESTFVIAGPVSSRSQKDADRWVSRDRPTTMSRRASRSRRRGSSSATRRFAPSGPDTKPASSPAQQFSQLPEVLRPR